MPALYLSRARPSELACLVVRTAIPAMNVTTIGEILEELALRTAPGATPARLHALVVRQQLWPVLAGTALGLLAASTMAQLITVLLFRVDARSPARYAGVAGLVIAASAVPAFVPALAASRIAPAQALKAE